MPGWASMQGDTCHTLSLARVKASAVLEAALPLPVRSRGTVPGLGFVQGGSVARLLQVPLLEGLIPALSCGLRRRQLCDLCRRALRGLLLASLQMTRRSQQAEAVAAHWLGCALHEAAACPTGCTHVLSRKIAKHTRLQSRPRCTRCMATYWVPSLPDRQLLVSVM